MQLTRLLTAGLVPSLVSAAVECDFATTAGGGATCENFASSWGMSLDDLKSLNAGIACPNLDAAKSYYVIDSVTFNPLACLRFKFKLYATGR